MTIYSAVLKHIKSTRQTQVYGNEDFQALYIPKHVLPPGDPAKEMKITIETLDTQPKEVA